MQVFEAPNPEDFDECLKAAREVLATAGAADRIIINYTGGTKPLSAALVHAALTAPVAGEIVFDYVGGERRNKTGRVIQEAMRIRRSEITFTQELCREVLGLLQQGQYARAHFLGERLPDVGRAHFLKRATEALRLWDDLDYAKAKEGLGRLRDTSKTFQHDPELGSLARTLVWLGENAEELDRTVRALWAHAQQSEAHKAQRPSLSEVGLLTADILENGLRRQQEGKATDAVLRAYRALEVACQGAILQRGINSWHPQWESVSQDVQKQYRERLRQEMAQPLPRELGLTQGLLLWEVLSGRRLSKEEQKMLEDLRAARNHSYLEHAFRRHGQQDAERLLNYAQKLAEVVLETTLKPLRQRVSHSFQ